MFNSGIQTLFYIFFALISCLLSAPSFAADQYQVNPNGNWEIIDEHNVCRVVVNNGSESFMVPTRTSAEWSSFLGDPPPNTDIQQCLYEYTSWSGWSSCSASCGGGTRSRSRTCELQGETVSCSNCGGVCYQEEACNTSACYSHAWETGSWTACTNACGVNTQSRNVYCERTSNTGSTSVVSDAYCSGSKPVSTQECGTIECSYEWQTTGWSSCSASCGGGAQTRSTYCVDNNGNNVSDWRCSSPEPSTSRSCNTQACSTSGPWSVGGWSSCSESCGGGTRTRSVTCNYDSCTGARPHSSEPCNTQGCGPICPAGATGICSTSDDCGRVEGQYNCVNNCCIPNEVGPWTVGGWGSCSVSCGGGIQTRTVRCDYADGCTGSRPSSSRSCNTQACATSGPWSVGGWSSCSASCGGGTQTRSVSCNYDSCTGSRPSSSQSCNTQSCVCAPNSTQTDNSTRSCPSGYSGNETGTRSRTCNSAGTAWGSWSAWSWNNSACVRQCREEDLPDVTVNLPTLCPNPDGYGRPLVKQVQLPSGGGSAWMTLYACTYDGGTQTVCD